MKLVHYDDPEVPMNYTLSFEDSSRYNLLGIELFPFTVIASWAHLPPWTVRKHYNREADEMERWVIDNIPRGDWTSFFIQVRGKCFHFKHRSDVMLFKLRFG